MVNFTTTFLITEMKSVSMVLLVTTIEISTFMIDKRWGRLAFVTELRNPSCRREIVLLIHRKLFLSHISLTSCLQMKIQEVSGTNRIVGWLIAKSCMFSNH